MLQTYMVKAINILPSHGGMRYLQLTPSKNLRLYYTPTARTLTCEYKYYNENYVTSFELKGRYTFSIKESSIETDDDNRLITDISDQKGIDDNLEGKNLPIL